MPEHVKPPHPLQLTLALIISCFGHKRTNNTQATEALKCIIKSFRNLGPGVIVFRQSFKVNESMMKIPENVINIFHTKSTTN